MSTKAALCMRSVAIVSSMALVSGIRSKRTAYIERRPEEAAGKLGIVEHERVGRVLTDKTMLAAVIDHLLLPRWLHVALSPATPRHHHPPHNPRPRSPCQGGACTVGSLWWDPRPATRPAGGLQKAHSRRLRGNRRVERAHAEVGRVADEAVHGRPDLQTAASEDNTMALSGMRCTHGAKGRVRRACGRCL